MKTTKSFKSAFTFIELLVVLSVIVLLAALLAPAMAFSRADSAAARCMSNHRQLVTAWQMYANVNRDFFPPNQNGGAVDGFIPTWCEGWLDWAQDTSDNTNWHQLINTLPPYGTSASLGPYLRGEYQVFKCPEDVYNCKEGTQILRALPRVRSVSMNGFIEGGAYTSSASGESDWYPTWRSYSKTSDVTHPSPGNLIVTLDEHADSINDAWFITDVLNSATWEDLPGSYHNGAAAMSFADGHTELHHWQRAATRQPVHKFYINGTISDTPGNVDISWLTNHVSTTVTSN